MLTISIFTKWLRSLPSNKRAKPSSLTLLPNWHTLTSVSLIQRVRTVRPPLAAPGRPKHGLPPPGIGSVPVLYFLTHFFDSSSVQTLRSNECFPCWATRSNMREWKESGAENQKITASTRLRALIRFWVNSSECEVYLIQVFSTVSHFASSILHLINFTTARE